MKEADRLDRTFHALADATRRSILSKIAEQECTVSELAEPFQMSLAAVSKHLKVLESAGLLTRTVDGRVHRCLLNGEPLQEASTVIQDYQKFWDTQLQSLEDFLKNLEKKKGSKNDSE